MKLANFKNTVINANYAFDSEAQVVINRKTNKSVAWEPSGKVRLTIDSERKRFTREEIISGVEIVSNKEHASRKNTISSQFRSKLAHLIDSGKTKKEAQAEMVKWASDKLASKNVAYSYFANNYDKVASAPSKYKL